MNKALSDFKRKAKTMAVAIGIPSFYSECAEPLEYARDTFFDHPPLLRLRDEVIPFLYDEFGHGIEHAKSVAIESGAILLAEATALRQAGETIPRGKARQWAILAQAAGLLHDICRLEDNHSLRSAEVATTILASYPFDDWQRATIIKAVSAHEDPACSLDGLSIAERLVAGALYDADVFRWGPDFFVTTLWEECDYEDWSDSDVIDRFPMAIDHLDNLVTSFRTSVGRKYGPQMLAVGRQMARQILPELQRYAASPQLRMVP